MEINLQKAEEYYSNLPDSVLLDYIQNKHSELNPAIILLIDKILKARGTPINDLNTIEPVQAKEQTNKYSWTLVIITFAIVVFCNMLTVGEMDNPFSKEF